MSTAPSAGPEDAHPSADLSAAQNLARQFIALGYHAAPGDRHGVEIRFDAAATILSILRDRQSGRAHDEPEGYQHYTAADAEADATGFDPGAADLADIGADYGDECVIELASGRTIRTDSYADSPEGSTYVRICDQDGTEAAYWTSDEWREEPGEVMGAILGAAKGAG